MINFGASKPGVVGGGVSGPSPLDPLVCHGLFSISYSVRHKLLLVCEAN